MSTRHGSRIDYRHCLATGFSKITSVMSTNPSLFIDLLKVSKKKFQKTFVVNSKEIQRVRKKVKFLRSQFQLNATQITNIITLSDVPNHTCGQMTDPVINRVSEKDGMF